MTADRMKLACMALASVVRAEYGPRYTLAEIANTWGECVTTEQVDALRQLEGSVAKPADELFGESAQGIEVQATEVPD
jgi:hypothetical protein